MLLRRDAQFSRAQHCTRLFFDYCGCNFVEVELVLHAMYPRPPTGKPTYTDVFPPKDLFACPIYFDD